ncbi:MAG: hypothetical protein K6U74_02025 [Firmicutes bacterium]|nr:hypothetical protein [Bacillota bacterium]
MVESLVLVAMLTLVVSHRLLNHMRLLAPEKSARFTPLRWAESFYSIAPVIMVRVLKFVGIDEDPFTSWLRGLIPMSTENACCHPG